MRTNFSRKTINTYIYLKKKPVINKKSTDKQVHITKASNKWKSIPKAIVVLYIFFFDLLEEKPE